VGLRGAWALRGPDGPCLDDARLPAAWQVPRKPARPRGTRRRDGGASGGGGPRGSRGRPRSGARPSSLYATTRATGARGGRRIGHDQGLQLRPLDDHDSRRRQGHVGERRTVQPHRDRRRRVQHGRPAFGPERFAALPTRGHVQLPFMRATVAVVAASSSNATPSGAQAGSGGAGAAPAQAPGRGSAASTAQGPTLPNTGFSVRGEIIAGLAMLGLGTVLLLLSARRPPPHLETQGRGPRSRALPLSHRHPPEPPMSLPRGSPRNTRK
jgi:hypothetical protein